MEVLMRLYGRLLHLELGAAFRISMREVARAYGRLYATMPGSGRASRRRFADLLIAATALAHGLPLFTRNPADFSGLEDLIRINAL